MLKLKSLIYRYLGIYLAYPEQAEYMESEEFWTQFMEFMAHNHREYTPTDAQDLLIGLWQAKHEFSRPMCPSLVGRRPKAFWSVIEWIWCLYTTLKRDIERSLR